MHNTEEAAGFSDGSDNPQSIMTSNLVYGLVYYGRSLGLMVHLFLDVAITYEAKPPISDDVEIDAPDFFYVDLFFSYYLCHKLIDDDELYDAVETLHNNGTLGTDDTVPIYGDMNESGRKVSST